ncbi:MAG: hypothetical protein DDT25_01143 [Chloroflexi bacterium]|nr:hypothetical protein [Chloroflexota bacterium]
MGGLKVGLRFEILLMRKLLGFDFADIQIMNAGFVGGKHLHGLNLREAAIKDTDKKPDGIEYVFNNGIMIVKNGNYVVGEKPGRVIRRAG